MATVFLKRVYYEFTARMLIHLKEKWSSDPGFQWQYLIDEIDRTLAPIESKR